MNFSSGEITSPKSIEELIKEIHERVRSSKNMRDSLPDLIGQLKVFFNCEAITIFAVDQSARQLYSTSHISDTTPEIRVEISLNNLAGYVAGTGNPLNIANVKDKAELAQYHPHLSHDSKWDPVLSFVSKSMIVVPIPYKKNLIGILEIINKKNDLAFSAGDLKLVQDISPALGLVLVRYYNDALKNNSHEDTPADAIEPNLTGQDEDNNSESTPDEDTTSSEEYNITNQDEDIHSEPTPGGDTSTDSIESNDTGQDEDTRRENTSDEDTTSEESDIINQDEDIHNEYTPDLDAEPQDVSLETEILSNEIIEIDNNQDISNAGLNQTELEPENIEDQNVVQEETDYLELDRRAGSRRDEDKEKEILKIAQAIHNGKNLKVILSEFKDSILDNFDAEDITLYGLDSTKNEVVSKFQSRETSKEIRLPLAHSNIPGHVAMAKKPVNIENAENLEELKSYHSELETSDPEKDSFGYKTLELLALPVMHEETLLGVLKIVNKRNGTIFSEKDEKRAFIMAENLGYALAKQEKLSKHKPDKFSYLLENDLITEKELDSSLAYAKSNNIDIETVLLERVGLKRESLGLSLESFYGLPYYGYEKTIVLPAKILGGLNKNFLAKNFWLPVNSHNSKVVILINDPSNLDKIQNIRHIFPKKELEFKVGLKIDLNDFLNSISGQDEQPVALERTEKISSLIDSLLEENNDAQLETQSDDDLSELNDIKETDNAIIRLVNKILTDAYEIGATDIHIEPGIAKDNITIRFRKDGDCSIYEEIPFLYKHAIVSRIKIMANLDIAERRIPQDGKIKMRYGKVNIEYRVATCPTVGENEDIVLRILAKSESLPLGKMNFTDRNLQLIIKNVSTPYGLILVVGPTGSGKTTTLHSCLGHINTPRKKIWTVEDPVEITQKGIRQVQTIEKKGLDFPRAMRSFLRGDPDVIMVGEMRDKETASIGLEASLTGHLVFSTLHTNSAPETVTRLLDMGMNPLNFADSLLLVVAQRLVKTLCKNCKEDYHPTQEEFSIIVNEYGRENFEKLGILYDNDLTIKKPVGCDDCDNTGYSGRTAIHEVLEGTKELKRQIVKQASGEELRNTAIANGMCTLKQDGIQKIFNGDCDLKQVLAVCIL